MNTSRQVYLCKHRKKSYRGHAGLTWKAYERHVCVCVTGNTSQLTQLRREFRHGAAQNLRSDPEKGPESVPRLDEVPAGYRWGGSTLSSTCAAQRRRRAWTLNGRGQTLSFEDSFVLPAARLAGAMPGQSPTFDVRQFCPLVPPVALTAWASHRGVLFDGL